MFLIENCFCLKNTDGFTILQFTTVYFTVYCTDQKRAVVEFTARFTISSVLWPSVYVTASAATQFLYNLHRWRNILPVIPTRALFITCRLPVSKPVQHEQTGQQSASSRKIHITTHIFCWLCATPETEVKYYCSTSCTADMLSYLSAIPASRLAGLADLPEILSPWRIYLIYYHPSGFT